jgi:hypothetical protein
MAKEETKQEYVERMIKNGSSKTKKELAREFENKKNYSKLSWIDKVKTTFGAYSYLLDENMGLGSDVADVLRKAVELEYDDQFFITQIEGTEWFKSNDEKKRSFDLLDVATKERTIDLKMQDIRNNFGDIFKEPGSLRKVAMETARAGMSDQEFSNYVYARAFEGKSANLLLQNKDAQSVRALGSKYFMKLDDKQIQDVMIGKTTLPDLQANLVLSAKALFPQWSDQFDKGLTLDEIGKPYLGILQDLTERGDIQSTDPMMLKALELDSETGQAKSLTKWMSEIKSDPSYGYQYTTKANKDALNLTSTFARIFGKVV